MNGVCAGEADFMGKVIRPVDQSNAKIIGVEINGGEAGGRAARSAR